MNTGPDMLSAGLQMIAALAVVIALIFFLLQWLRRLGHQRTGIGGTKRIRVLESHYLGVKKSVCLVRVPGKVLVLGVCSDRINLLDTIDDDAVGDVTDKDTPIRFASVIADRLKKIGGGHKNGKNE
jgi:flagellar protein FliO/FliZ